MALKPRFLVYPSELIVASFGALAWTLYRSIDLPMRRPADLYQARIVQGLILYAVALTVLLLTHRLHSIRGKSRTERVPFAETIQSFCVDRLTPSRLLHDLRLLNVIALVFVVFIQLKHLTPILRTTLYDDMLFRSELQLFGGKLSGEHLVRMLPPDFTQVLSDSYVLFYPYMAVLIFFFLLRTPADAQRFCTSFALCWFIGALLIYAFPTWGPCFFRPELYSGLPTTQVSELQQDLWRNKLFLDTHPQSAEGVFLISGFPSLHIAVPLLGTILLRPVAPVLALMSAALTAFTTLATLYFGWHYLVDCLGAVPVVALALGLASILPGNSPANSSE